MITHRKIYDLSDTRAPFPFNCVPFWEKFLFAAVPAIRAFRPTPEDDLVDIRNDRPVLSGVMDGFQPNRQPPVKYADQGFTSFPVRVGDLMRWGETIPGTGTFFEKIDQLRKKLSSATCLEHMVSDIRLAIEDKAVSLGGRVQP